VPEDDLKRSRLLGFAGSALLALGGSAVGALPVRDPFESVPGLRELRAAPGIALVCGYLGLTLLIVAWLWLGRLVDRQALAGADSDNLPPAPEHNRHRPAHRPRRLLVVLAWWAAPLTVAPPLFSQDVYSYLAQGAMVVHGMDVYTLGPSALGGPLLADIPPVWRDTPAPYGPVFLSVAAAVARATDINVPLGVLSLRAVALVGVALLAIWLPRLAGRCGVCPSRALWLGVLNPLVLAHLVAGAHNDALMLGLLVCGLAAASAGRPVLGVALVALAALVKAPAVLALPACAALWAGQLGGGWRAPRAAAGTAAVALALTAAVTALSGHGYGWVAALRTPARVHNGLSLTTDAGRLLAHLSEDLAEVAVPLARACGLALAAAACLVCWLRGRRYGQGLRVSGRRRAGQEQVYPLGLALICVVLLSPAVHMWYLLWGIVPIAAAAPDGAVRRWAGRACAVLALVLLPDGDMPTLKTLSQAALGVALAAVGLLAYALWRRATSDGRSLAIMGMTKRNRVMAE
jgi:alpha-1,6-mannosyltransferase